MREEVREEGREGEEEGEGRGEREGGERERGVVWCGVVVWCGGGGWGWVVREVGGWVGLGWVGLGWVGVGWVGLGGVGSHVWVVIVLVPSRHSSQYHNTGTFNSVCKSVCERKKCASPHVAVGLARPVVRLVVSSTRGFGAQEEQVLAQESWTRRCRQ